MILPPWLQDRLGAGDERFVVTGASGWFGRTTLELLWRALGAEAAERRVSALAGTAKIIKLSDGTAVRALPLAEMVAPPPGPTLILHYAFPTRDRVAVLGRDAFAAMAASLSLAMARLVESGGVRGLFVTSSGAVYDGVGGCTSDIDLNPYGAMKHLDELALRQACRDVGATAVVARVFSVSGPYMTRPHIYALGDLIAQVKAGGPVHVRAQGPVLRSYVAVADLVAVALAELLEPAGPEMVFDGAGEEVVEVGELARRVGTVLGGRSLDVVREVDATAPADFYVGEATTLLGLAKARDVHLLDLDAQIADTAEQEE